MRLSVFITWIGILLAPMLLSQIKLDLVLEEKLKENDFSGKAQNFIVKGDHDAIFNWLLLNKGKIKYVSKAGIAIRLNANKIKELASLPEVDHIYFNNYKGAVLNDRVIQNANVAGLQTDWEFDSTLTGKGIIIGFIDAGIDYTHQDFIDKDSLSRILFIWDQNNPEDSSLIFEDYGYGRLITGDTLNDWLANNIQVPLDPNSLFGHGSTVAGAACANGRALAEELEQGIVPSDLQGIAPDSKIIMVSSDFGSDNWLATIADGVDFMLNVADELDMPIVINLSVGTYLGSHDGLDPVGSTINEWFSDQYPGRMLVCAGGNSGQLRYHLGYHSNSDTSLSIFKTHNGLSELGKGAFFELWIDSISANDFSTAVGLIDITDLSVPVLSTFRSIALQIDSLIIDTLYDGDTPLGVVSQFTEYRGDQVRMQVKVDSVLAANLEVAFYTLGQGRVDCWSADWLGTSDIIGPEQMGSLPPAIGEKYRSPDSLMQVVSSFSCAPNVLTVGNYKNRVKYTDVNGSIQEFEGEVGERTKGSSRGPTRDGRQKPDISASGDLVLSTGAYNVVDILLSSEPYKVALGGKHIRNGGTSMASPIVAGIVALYLQHCPESLPSEISNSIIGTAFQDIFTGVLPNPEWGNGKVNGLAAVNSSLIYVEITGSDVCLEGELELSTTFGYSTYLWSTGETTAQICAVPGEYWVKVTDQSGCWSVSDNFTVVIEGVKELDRSEKLVFPNPNQGTFTLINLEPDQNLRILNILGQQVGFEMKKNGSRTDIILKDNKPGIYFIRFSESGLSIRIVVN